MKTLLSTPASIETIKEAHEILTAMNKVYLSVQLKGQIIIDGKLQELTIQPLGDQIDVRWDWDMTTPSEIHDVDDTKLEGISSIEVLGDLLQ